MKEEVTLRLLAQVADKMYAKHLQRFALVVVGLEDAKCSNIISEAGNDSWEQCYGVNLLFLKTRITNTCNIVNITLQPNKLFSMK